MHASHVRMRRLIPLLLEPQDKIANHLHRIDAHRCASLLAERGVLFGLAYTRMLVVSLVKGLQNENVLASSMLLYPGPSGRSNACF